MRIAHVLTYVSADGAYGGPLAVAAAHCTELAARGHEVTLLAGWDGEAAYDLPGVQVRLFRVHRVAPGGFAGLASPGLLAALLRSARDFDVVHVHLARDLVVLPAALAALRAPGPRVFVQTHGMVQPDFRLLARVVDVGIRRVLRGVGAAFALHPAEVAALRTVAAGPVTVVELPNGVTAQEPRSTTHEVPELLFLARLQPRKRVMVFAEAARRLVAAGVAARFAVAGPDEGDLPQLQAFLAEHGLTDVVRYEGPVGPGRGPDRLREADVFVLPSSREPFPMTVLEALSVGTPAVVSADCAVADRLESAGGTVLFDGTVEGLTEVLTALVSDPARRRELRRAAGDAIETTFGVASVVDRLEACYLGVEASEPSARAAA